MGFRRSKGTLKILNQTEFTSKFVNPGKRLIHKDGSFNITRVGRKSFDPYHFVFEISWGRFLLGILFFFFSANLLFAIGFFMIGVDQIEGIAPGMPSHRKLLDCFFMSIQTFTTVGYGRLNPIGMGASILSAFVSFFGFFSFSIFTGISLARFAKPQSKILFSKIALLNTGKKPPCLQFRIVNAHHAKLFSVEATVVMTSLSEDRNGDLRREFRSLSLEYQKIIMLPIDWTITHFIDKNSPLQGLSHQQVIDLEAEFLVSIKAYDDAYNQVIHASHSYLFNEIIWGAEFMIMYKDHNHTTIVDLNSLSDFRLIE